MKTIKELYKFLYESVGQNTSSVSQKDVENKGSIKPIGYIPSAKNWIKYFEKYGRILKIDSSYDKDDVYFRPFISGEKSVRFKNIKKEIPGEKYPLYLIEITFKVYREDVEKKSVEPYIDFWWDINPYNFNQEYGNFCYWKKMSNVEKIDCLKYIPNIKDYCDIPIFNEKFSIGE